MPSPHVFDLCPFVHGQGFADNLVMRADYLHRAFIADFLRLRCRIDDIGEQHDHEIGSSFFFSRTGRFVPILQGTFQLQVGTLILEEILHRRAAKIVHLQILRLHQVFVDICTERECGVLVVP